MPIEPIEHPIYVFVTGTQSPQLASLNACLIEHKLSYFSPYRSILVHGGCSGIDRTHGFDLKVVELETPT